jgi:hypothetical protein
MVFLIAPALLFIAGIASDLLRSREERAAVKPWISYLAGFLGAAMAIFLIILGMYRDRMSRPWHPAFCPGWHFWPAWKSSACRYSS